MTHLVVVKLLLVGPFALVCRRREWDVRTLLSLFMSLIVENTKDADARGAVGAGTHLVSSSFHRRRENEKRRGVSTVVDALSSRVSRVCLRKYVSTK